MVLERDQDVPSSHIPVIDLSSSNQEQVARAVVKASEEWGVFQVVNHGIPTKVIQRLQTVGRQFFELPKAEKEAVAKLPDSHEGYARLFELDLEKKTGTVDQLFHYIWPPSSVNYKYWPTNPLDYSESSINESAIIPDNMVLERDQDIPSSHIPVVDLSNPNEELVARGVVKASEEWGVFQVVNHGIPTNVIQRLQNVGRQFFELPEAEKKAVAKSANHREGYARRNELDLEKKTGTVDQLYHNVWPPSSVNYKYWPNNPLDYREANEEYTKHIKMLSEKIMEWLSEGLGLRGEAIKEVTGGEYMMLVNYYPPCPHSDLIEGLGPHTDVSGLTLLLPNEIPGLQVFKDDQWFDVENIPSAVTVIIGDQILRLSNGRYKNVLHKTTVDNERTRMSWPVLVRPTNDMVVGPFPEITSHDDPPKFKPITYKEYIYRKMRHLRFVDLAS